MNTTPRGLNRTLLALLGLLLLVAGGALAALGLVPGFAASWRQGGEQSWAWVRNQLHAAAIGGWDLSWWTLAVLLLLVVAAFLLVRWIAAQGGGRSHRLGGRGSVEGRGTTVVDTAVVAQEFLDALAGHGQVLATSVQSWHARGADGLTLTVQARKGASPGELTETVQELIAGLDVLLGEQVPVLVRITAGARTRFARASRVR